MNRGLPILILLLFFIPASLISQDLWKKTNLTEFRSASDANTIVIPEHYTAYTLSFEKLLASVEEVPSEDEMRAGLPGKIISLPLPDGSFEQFEIYDSPVMAPGLAARYPSIKSFKGKSLKSSSTNVRLDFGPYGFHAAIHSIDGVIYIDPYSRDNKYEYLTFNVKDQVSQIDLPVPFCGLKHEAEQLKDEMHSKPRSSMPVSLQTYRLAIACTGEWGSVRGTVEKVLADMNTAVNRVNQIFENELAIRMVLIENTDQLIYFDASTDPYSITLDPGSDPNATADESAALNTNTDVLDVVIGSQNYDVGHLFHNRCNVGGIAFLSSMCRFSNKGGGLTCFGSTNVSFIASQTMAHELGHQMAAQHTFSYCLGDGNESLNNAYEPGGGSTIMSYGSACQSNSVISTPRDDYYHVASLIQMYNHTREGIAGDGCAEYIPTSNIEPTVNILHPNDFYIPEDTPFFLEGEAFDENEEDELTYCWEQFNVGNPLDGLSELGMPRGDAAHFRTLPPNSRPRRYFPSIDNIITGSFDRTEVPFLGDRTVNFMLTVRDNNAEAGTAVWEEVQFHIVETPEKFGITSQSTPEVYEVGQEVDVNWNVAGTNFPPVDAQFVDILMYTGPFLSFDIDDTHMLAERVFNSGSCKVVLPDVVASDALFIVKASDSNFFSVNRRSFRINAAQSPSLAINPNPIANIDCVPADFTYEIGTEGLAGLEGSVTFSILEGLPEGAEATFEPETVTVGETSTLTINPEYDPIGSDHEIRILGITESMDSFYRSIYLNLKSTDHSQLMAVEPVQNQTGLGITTPFSWTASPNADFYRFELSASPEFGATNIAFVDDLTELSYEPEIFLEKNTAYYWRVTARNYCGDDPHVRTFAFSTESLSCSEIRPEEGVLPINISASGRPTIQAPIEVSASGEVADINVKQWFGQHENNRDMIVKLISPEGKEVTLVNRKCNQSNFNCAFDDAASVPVQCPLNNGFIYRPQEPLADFNGDALEGTWIFQIEDVQPGNGGRLDALLIEFCSNQVLDNPYLVRNEKLSIPYDRTITIGRNRLLTEDDNNTSEELIYTIVDLPKQGTLLYDELPVNRGDQFTQADIDNDMLSYTSISEDYATFFTFTVIDGEGGFIGVTEFEIEVNSTTSVNEEELLEQEISIYPIPAQDLITIDLTRTTKDFNSVQILNIQGQVMLQSNLNKRGKQVLDIQNLQAGFYIVNFKSNDSLISKKIVVN